MRIRLVGGNALLLEVDDPAGWFAELMGRREAGELAAVDIVPGASTVLVDGLANQAATAAAIRGWTPTRVADEVRTSSINIPVEFDGEDLDTVAQLWQTDDHGVVDRLCTTQLRVAFCGFSPGWAYLSGLPEELAVPRLETPRARVPAGSVALAGPYAGIYPSAAPGGWLLVGRTDVTLFDPSRSPPALLSPGMRVRFVQRSGR